ncbi:MAG: hypothetical protein ACPHEP_10150 [Acidimicrobiales bacterium]
MRSLRRQISDREKLPKIGTMGSLGQTVQGGRLQSPSLSLRQPLPSVDPRNFTPVPDSAVKAMQKRLPSRGPVPIRDFIASVGSSVESGARGAAGMLNRAARSMVQAGVPMASKATGLTPDQVSSILPIIGRDTTEVDTGILRDFRDTMRPATAAGSGTVIAPGQDQKVMKSRVRSELNKFNPQSLITKSETGLAIEESKNREQAARDEIAAINAERERLNPVYDSSSPFNMAMSVAPRENMKIDEGMVAESAQRARERLAGATQPGGMVSTDALGRMADREAQARLAPQRALAQREDVSAQSGRGFTRTVDRDPDSPTFGRATVVGTRPVYGPNVTESVKSYLDKGGSINAGTPAARAAKSALMTAQQPRRDARMAGEVFEDPATGAITDYGKLNARNQRRAEESQAARELRTRTAQVQGMNPRLSRAGAAGVAAGQLRDEQLMQEEMTRQQEAAQFDRDMRERELQIKENAADDPTKEMERKLAEGEFNKIEQDQLLAQSPAFGGEILGPDASPSRRVEGLVALVNDESLSEKQKDELVKRQFQIFDRQGLVSALGKAGYDQPGMSLYDYITGNLFQGDDADERRDRVMRGLGYEPDPYRLPGPLGVVKNLLFDR